MDNLHKPDSETFLKAAEALGVKPEDCIVFEDAPKGVEAAKNAGMKCVALTTAHEEDGFKEHDNVLFFIKDYRDAEVLELLLKGKNRNWNNALLNRDRSFKLIKQYFG